jgi:hypothetical protein
MAIEKSYIDMVKERDAKIEALKELLTLSHESLDSKDKRIAELDKECINAKNYMVDLSKTVTQYGNKIAELEAFNQEQGQLMSAMTEYYEGDNGVAFHSYGLEQQAKGVNDFANKFCGDCKTLEQADVSSRAESFIKALKEQE